MRPLSLTPLLIVLSVTLSCREAAPLDRLKIADISPGSSEDGRTTAAQDKHPVLSPTSDVSAAQTARQKRSQMEKRRCNTATCATQRLVDFLVRSNNNHGPIYSPTNVGSYTYGKRDIVGLLRRESFDYLQH